MYIPNHPHTGEINGYVPLDSTAVDPYSTAVDPYRWPGIRPYPYPSRPYQDIEIDNLRDEIAGLREENERLTRENEKLRERLYSENKSF